MDSHNTHGWVTDSGTIFKDGTNDELRANLEKTLSGGEQRQRWTRHPPWHHQWLGGAAIYVVWTA